MASSDSDGNNSDVEATTPIESVPKKRGRPAKVVVEQEKDEEFEGDGQDDLVGGDGDFEPSPKKRPGRPKGAKNKGATAKEKTEEKPGPKRGRGRPRKNPPAEPKDPGVKRPRGRPKKNPDPEPVEEDAAED